MLLLLPLLLQLAYGHANLVRPLERNYRSTPQILQVMPLFQCC
jgi:hypothetical protein